MANLNKVFLAGNLTRDPELRYTQGGMAICNLGLAVNRRYLSRSNEEVEEVCFVDVDVFGKQAESSKNYLQKGAPCLIEGRLHYDSWDDRATGQKRSKLNVVAERVQFLGAPSRGAGFGGGEQSGNAPARGPSQGGGYQQSPGGFRPPPQAQQSQQPPPQPQQQWQQKPQPQPPAMPAFDTSGLDDDRGAAGAGGFDEGDDIPDQIPF